MRLVLPCLLLAALVAPHMALAQDGGFLNQFHFDTLWFKFYPNGLANADEKGSGLEAFGQNVKIEGAEATDLRHCIDGWGQPDCSAGALLTQFYHGGNHDGVVTPNEVAAFTPLAKSFAGSFDTVRRLSDMLQNNLTVDGVHGGTPRVVDLVLRDVEGPVGSTATAFADVTTDVGYNNDKAAHRHEIHLAPFHLAAEGFQGQSIRWTLESAKGWSYRPDETQPTAFKAMVTSAGWTSGQADFEQASDQGLRLVTALGAKKKTPAPDEFLVLASIAAALLVAVRRR